MNLPDRIRQTIGPAHVTVEQTPFAQLMANGQISRRDYVTGLEQLGHLHAGLEAALTAVVTHERVAALFNPTTMTRAPLIERDLAVLGDTIQQEISEIVIRLSNRFQNWIESAPHKLIGALYVLEGSRMGSMVLARSLTKALRVEPRLGAGLDYHVDGIATRPADWKKFKETLISLTWTAAEEDDVCAAANETMDGLVELYASFPIAVVNEPQLI